jgi:cell division initiation protein
MNINSEYIQKKEFHTAFKGYSMEEVDKFLDILAVEFDRINKKNKELQDALDQYKYEGKKEQEEDVSKLVSDVLISAHKVADEIKRKAEEEAKEIIENKKNIESNELRDLLKEKKAIEEKIKYLINFYNEFLDVFKNILNDFNKKITEIEKDSNIIDLKEKVKVFEQELINNKETDKFKVDENYEENIKNNYENNNQYKESIKPDLLNPEIEKISDKEKEIREFIEKEENNNIEKEKSNKDFKTENDIFDSYNEDKIRKENKKIDIGNPDIISEFFGDNDERKY